MRKIIIALLVLGIVGCGGGGGGGSSDKCISYAEYLCARLVDCLDINSQAREDQCFAQASNFIGERGDSQDFCKQQEDAVSGLSCGQIIAIANLSSITRSEIKPELGNVAVEFLQRN